MKIIEMKSCNKMGVIGQFGLGARSSKFVQ